MSNKNNEIKNNFKEALLKLSDEKTLAALEEMVLKKTDGTGKLSICLPREENKRNKIHLMLEYEGDKTLSFFTLSELTSDIEDLLNYRKVLVLFKGLFKKEKFDQLYTGETWLSRENSASVVSFLEENYKISSQVIVQIGLPRWRQ